MARVGKAQLFCDFVEPIGMGRQIRVVPENTLYEIVPRARERLPLPSTATTNQLLTGHPLLVHGRNSRDSIALNRCEWLLATPDAT
jgi:hypothetical protein